MSEPLLEVQGVSAAYGRVEVLHEVGLKVEKGTTVALIGSNGAGKSTLVRAINGLLPMRAGSVRLSGQAIDGQAAFARTRAGIATVAEGRRLFPEMSVEENLLAAATFGAARERRQHTRDECFAMFPRLRERARQAAGSLSGGEQQMVAIARALMTQPQLLILDEPSTGLAPRVVGEIFATLAALQRRGIAILLVEQNVALSLQVASYAYVLAQGRVVLQGKAADLAQDAGVRSAYLGG